MAETSETPTLTPAFIERSARFESIFMPSSRKKRDDLMALEKEGEGRFIHYTTAEAALSIIKSKRFWLRSTMCMTDYREVLHGFNALQRIVQDEKRFAPFKALLNQCHNGVVDDAVALFDSVWQDTQINTFIGSLSEHFAKEDVNGRLSMWRGFGGNKARVGLVLKIPLLSGAGLAMNISLNPVIYFGDDELSAEIEGVCRKIAEEENLLREAPRDEVRNWIFTMLHYGTLCMKHEGFHEEREWRVVYSPGIARSDLIDRQVITIDGIPQVVHVLPLDATVSPAIAGLDVATIFDRLIIGPSSFPASMYGAFVEALTGIGVADAQNRVVASNIPIRT